MKLTTVGQNLSKRLSILQKFGVWSGAEVRKSSWNFRESHELDGDARDAERGPLRARPRTCWRRHQRPHLTCAVRASVRSTMRATGFFFFHASHEEV